MEKEEILETFEVLSGQQQMAGTKKDQNDFQQNRSKKIKSVKEL